MAEIQGDRILRLRATFPRVNQVPIPASTPISGAAPGTTIGSISNTADYAATRPVGDITAQVLANSGTTIQSYAATLFDFVNGAFRLQLGAGGLAASYNGVATLALSSMGGATFSGDIVTNGQIIGSGTNSSFAGYHGAVIGLAGPNSAGVLAYGGPGNAWAIQAIATGGNALFVQGDMWLNGGSAQFDGALRVGGDVRVDGTINGYNLSALPYAAPLHSHWIWDIYPSPYSANFSFSSDGGSTWTPIKLRRDA